MNGAKARAAGWPWPDPPTGEVSARAVALRRFVPTLRGLRGSDRLSLGADLEIAERGVPVDLGVLGQTEHPLADEVALDLVGAAGDGAGRRRQRREGPPAGRRPVGRPGLGRG